MNSNQLKLSSKEECHYETNCKLSKQDAYEIISAMIQQEQHYQCSNYLSHCKTNEIVEIAISNRSKVCNWMFQIVEIVGLDRETAISGMSFLDRYLCSDSPLARKAATLEDMHHYILAAMTCLYITIKMSGELEAHKASGLLEIGESYTSKDIVSFELEVLTSLQWKLNGPSALQYIRYASDLLPKSANSLSATIYEYAKLQTELAVGDYPLIGLNRSTIAMASLLNSVAQVNLPLQKRIVYQKELSNAFGIDVESPLVYAARGRLLDALASHQAAESVIVHEHFVQSGHSKKVQDLSTQDDLTAFTHEESSFESEVWCSNDDSDEEDWFHLQ